MTTLYITFGQKYYHEDHTYLPRWAADPDGWLEVRADTREHATGLLAKYVGATPSSAIECAGIYDTVEAVEPQWYERGCVGWIDTDGLHRAEVTPLTDALDRAAQAAWEANGYAKYSDADWPDLPVHVRAHWCEVAAAALRVMADDLSAALQHDAESVLMYRSHPKSADNRFHDDNCWQVHPDCALLRAASMARGWLDD